MTTRRISELLKHLLNEIGECQADLFRDCGLLTSNDGIVLSTGDGSEFQITVVRSR